MTNCEASGASGPIRVPSMYSIVESETVVRAALDLLGARRITSYEVAKRPRDGPNRPTKAPFGSDPATVSPSARLRATDRHYLYSFGPTALGACEELRFGAERLSRFRMQRTDQPSPAARREDIRRAQRESRRIANVRGFILFVLLLVSIWAILRLILAPHVS